MVEGALRPPKSWEVTAIYIVSLNSASAHPIVMCILLFLKSIQETVPVLDRHIWETKEVVTTEEGEKKGLIER